MFILGLLFLFFGSTYCLILLNSTYISIILILLSSLFYVSYCVFYAACQTNLLPILSYSIIIFFFYSSQVLPNCILFSLTASSSFPWVFLWFFVFLLQRSNWFIRFLVHVEIFIHKFHLSQGNTFLVDIVYQEFLLLIPPCLLYFYRCCASLFYVADY